MKYLVTGGTGFIGGTIARELSAQGSEVLVTGLEDKQIPRGAQYLGADFANLDWDKLGKLDALFHQAANNDTTSTDHVAMFKSNVDDSKKLFEAATNYGCAKIVYASSTAVYGNSPAPQREDGPLQPLNVYAESKIAQDKFAMEFARAHPQVLVVGLRYCNIYGSGEKRKGRRATMIPQLAMQMQTGRPKIFKDGEQQRDYLYVKDAVRANLLALQAPQSLILNCGFGRATSFNDLVKVLNSILGTAWEPEYIDNPYAAHYQNHTECDMALAREKISFVPEFDIERGIRDYHRNGELV